VFQLSLFWSENVNYIDKFGLHHLIYIIILFVCATFLVRKRFRIKTNKDHYRKVILAISIFQQLLLYSWYYFELGFDLSESLPFHICRISTLLGIWFLITKDKKVIDTAFYFGLFAYGSFIYPSRVYPIYHAIGLSFIINHTITILLPWFAYIAYDWRPSFKGLLKTLGLFTIYFLFVFILNPMIDGNYFYLKYRPFFKTLSDNLYILLVFAVTISGFSLAYKVADTFIKPSEKGI